MLGTTWFHRGEERPDNELLGVVYFCMITDGEGNSLDVRPEIQKSLEHDTYRWVQRNRRVNF